jgi:putative protease
MKMTVQRDQPSWLAAGPEGRQADASLRASLGKLGNTMFVPVAWTEAFAAVVRAVGRHQCCAATPSRRMKRCGWRRGNARSANRRQPPAVYPDTQLSYLANVYNEKARAFYHKHGVQLIAAAYEAHEEAGEVPLMITKHCLRFSFNLCPKQAKGVQGVQGQVRAEPMTLVSGDETYTLRFDCKPCEMHVVGAMKPGILKSAPPSNIPYSPITFHRQRPNS